MKISRQNQSNASGNWKGWHILTVGEAGFSMLDGYARHHHGIDIQIIQRFADKINQRDESGSLYPKAPISAIPRRFFRDISENEIPNHLDDFKHHIKEFIEANRNKIHARKILIDFHVSPEPVSELYLAATEQIFKEHTNESEIDEIVLFT
ncbi:MAG: hypothetical protein RKO25_02160 [Candidatus Contendobacter sp.]|nr:hypothetical protein [Candidatus Contendobacter sp.]